MADPFGNFSSDLSAPASRAASVTPSDTQDMQTTCRAIFVGGAGDVTLDTAGGDESVTFSGAVAGTVLAIRTKRVRATGTTATNLVALW